MTEHLDFESSDQVARFAQLLIRLTKPPTQKDQQFGFMVDLDLLPTSVGLTENGQDDSRSLPDSVNALLSRKNVEAYDGLKEELLNWQTTNEIKKLQDQADNDGGGGSKPNVSPEAISDDDLTIIAQALEKGLSDDKRLEQLLKASQKNSKRRKEVDELLVKFITAETKGGTKSEWQQLAKTIVELKEDLNNSISKEEFVDKFRKAASRIGHSEDDAKQVAEDAYKKCEKKKSIEAISAELAPLGNDLDRKEWAKKILALAAPEDDSRIILNDRILDSQKDVRASIAELWKRLLDYQSRLPDARCGVGLKKKWGMCIHDVLERLLDRLEDLPSRLQDQDFGFEDAVEHLHLTHSEESGWRVDDNYDPTHGKIATGRVKPAVMVNLSQDTSANNESVRQAIAEATTVAQFVVIKENQNGTDLALRNMERWCKEEGQPYLTDSTVEKLANSRASYIELLSWNREAMLTLLAVSTCIEEELCWIESRQRYLEFQLDRAATLSNSEFSSLLKEFKLHLKGELDAFSNRLLEEKAQQVQQIVSDFELKFETIGDRNSVGCQFTSWAPVETTRENDGVDAVNEIWQVRKEVATDLWQIDADLTGADRSSGFESFFHQLKEHVITPEVEVISNRIGVNEYQAPNIKSEASPIQSFFCFKGQGGKREIFETTLSNLEKIPKVIPKATCLQNFDWGNGKLFGGLVKSAVAIPAKILAAVFMLFAPLILLGYDNVLKKAVKGIGSETGLDPLTFLATFAVAIAIFFATIGFAKYFKQKRWPFTWLLGGGAGTAFIGIAGIVSGFLITSPIQQASCPDPSFGDVAELKSTEVDAALSEAGFTELTREKVTEGDEGQDPAPVSEDTPVAKVAKLSLNEFVGRLTGEAAKGIEVHPHARQLLEELKLRLGSVRTRDDNNATIIDSPLVEQLRSYTGTYQLGDDDAPHDFASYDNSIEEQVKGLPATAVNQLLRKFGNQPWNNETVYAVLKEQTPAFKKLVIDELSRQVAAEETQDADAKTKNELLGPAMANAGLNGELAKELLITYRTQHELRPAYWRGVRTSLGIIDPSLPLWSRWNFWIGVLALLVVLGMVVFFWWQRRSLVVFLTMVSLVIAIVFANLINSSSMSEPEKDQLHQSKWPAQMAADGQTAVEFQKHTGLNWIGSAATFHLFDSWDPRNGGNVDKTTPFLPKWSVWPGLGLFSALLVSLWLAHREHDRQVRQKREDANQYFKQALLTNGRKTILDRQRQQESELKRALAVWLDINFRILEHDLERQFKEQTQALAIKRDGVSRKLALNQRSREDLRQLRGATQTANECLVDLRDEVFKATKAEFEDRGSRKGDR